MCCWFCESPLRYAGRVTDGPERGLSLFYCPFADCPALKDHAGGAQLDGPETERWRCMREGGSLEKNLVEAGLINSPCAARPPGEGPGTGLGDGIKVAGL